MCFFNSVRILLFLIFFEAFRAGSNVSAYIKKRVVREVGVIFSCQHIHDWLHMIIIYLLNNLLWFLANILWCGIGTLVGSMYTFQQFHSECRWARHNSFQRGDERKADRIPSHFNVQITSWVVNNRVLLRFEFNALHQILYPTLATNEKWPLTLIGMSYESAT